VDLPADASPAGAVVWVGKDVAATGAVAIGAKTTAANHDVIVKKGQTASGTMLELAGAPAYAFPVDVTGVLKANPAASGAAAVCDKLPAADEAHTKCLSGPSWYIHSLQIPWVAMATRRRHPAALHAQMSRRCSPPLTMPTWN